MKNKLFALSVFALLTAGSLASCGNNGDDDANLPFNFAPDYSIVDASKVEGKTLKVGAILIGDNTESYTNAHILGMEKAAKVLKDAGANVDLSFEYKIADDKPELVKSKVESFVAADKQIVITNSYGHQKAFGAGQFDVTTQPNVDFISMTGDSAKASGQANYHNAFNATYQSRYVSGYVAGLKIKELVADGKIAAKNKDANGAVKVGYVGAFNFAEVRSGYTGFFLGIQKALEGTETTVSMKVQFTSSWWDHDGEKAAAKALIADGCVILSQHADSTGCPEACEEEFQNGTTVYNVGYNVSMIEAAPHASLTSATNDWSVYYTQAFYKKLAGEPIPVDWAEGYNKGAVAITKLNYDCFTTSASELDAAVLAVATSLKNGSLKAFDCSKWTKGGEHLTSYTGSFGLNGAETIAHEGDVYYFDESNSATRSAPYFDIVIDGITELN